MKKKLMKGHEISFTNNVNEDLMILSYKKTLSGQFMFIIWLNSKIIKMTKTFEPFEKKVNELIKERNLQIIK